MVVKRMKLQSSCVAGLLVIASIVQGFERVKWSQYHVPWACSVVHVEGNLVGACTIFDSTKVFVSVDNFNETVKDFKTLRNYYQVVDKLYVYAGSNLMDPQRLKPWEAPPAFQVKRGKKLYVASSHTGGSWEYKESPIQDLSEESGVEYDHYGVAFNIGILVLYKPFIWTWVVQPIPIPSDVAGKTRDYLYRLEILHFLPRDLPADTCITYSWNQRTNKIRYHLVTFQPLENCLDLFCTWNISTCDLFPQKPYHVCFKSVSYADVCPNARGAALYCPSFHKSVFAILTTAPSCGQRHMPGVYTTLPLAIEFYEAAFNVKFNVDERPKYDPLGLDQGYSPWG